jgi:hypothetical protein
MTGRDRAGPCPVSDRAIDGRAGPSDALAFRVGFPLWLLG